MKKSSLIGFGVLAVFAVVNFAAAATTISTNIQTDGTLSVTGQSALLGNVGIGTTSPQYLLDIEKSSGGNILNLQSNNSYASFQAISYRNSATTHAQYDGYGYRGTSAAPLALTDGDAVTSIRAEAYDGTPGTGGNGDGTNEIASMDIMADENQTTINQGGSFWFSTTNGALLNQAQINNGFPLTGTQVFPDSRFYIGSNGNIGIGTGDVNCAPFTTCFLNADVDHHFPTQVYFGSNNGGAGKIGPYNTAYSTKVVIVPGTSQSTVPLLTVVGSAASTTFSSSGNVGIGTSTPATRLQVSNGANATTTVTIGELGLTTSKGCVNMNRADGGAGSFYINAAGTGFVVEPNYCR